VTSPRRFLTFRAFPDTRTPAPETKENANGVDSHLDDHWSGWLGVLGLTRNDDGTTTAAVSVADQAQLHGVLAGLRNIGAVLVELRVIERTLRVER
jgi:hypothetical protein